MQKKTVVGQVKQVLDNRNYIVSLDEREITCNLSSKIKLQMTKEIMINEIVAITLSPIDSSKGRITYRHQIMNKYFKNDKN